MLLFTSLTQPEIDSIKQSIAFKTGRFDFDVTDQEVWDEVEEKLRELDESRTDKCIATGEEYEEVSFEEAAEYCGDDWGVYYATIASTSYGQKGNTFLTFPTI